MLSASVGQTLGNRGVDTVVPLIAGRKWEEIEIDVTCSSLDGSADRVFR